METLFGYPAHQWTDDPSFWSDHVYHEDFGPIWLQRSSAIRERRLSDLEYRIVAADGHAVWIRELCQLSSMNTGHPVVVGLIIDLSKKRSPAEALGKNKRWLRQVIDTIPQQIWSGPGDGSVDFCNARWRSDLGIALEELEGDGWQRMLHPEDRNIVLERWRRSVATGEPYESEERHRMADGQYR